MEFKENNPDCDCCEDEGPPCEAFADDFNRTDSSTPGNGWTGTASIKNNRLEIMGANNVMAPEDGGPGSLIQATVRFSGPNQEFRLYWGGTGNYVGFRPTNYDASTKRNIYIFANGALQSSAVYGNGTLTMDTPYIISVCVDNDSATSTGVSYNATAMPTGQAGVGAVGSFSNGPVIVDDFKISLVSDACHTCDLPFDDCEQNCSGEFSWLLDLSAFSGMVKNARPDYPADCDCHNLGTYLLEPSGFCSWSYAENYCPHFNNCPSQFSISLVISGNNCGPVHLSFGFSNIPCFRATYSNSTQYVADEFAMATAGNGVVTLRHDPILTDVPNNTFGHNWDAFSFDYIDPMCVKEFIQDPSGVDRFTCITVPATVTMTRVG